MCRMPRLTGVDLFRGTSCIPRNRKNVPEQMCRNRSRGNTIPDFCLNLSNSARSPVLARVLAPLRTRCAVLAR
eukprot:365923-Chlamydomonas_euryale.AAC.3